MYILYQLTRWTPYVSLSLQRIAGVMLSWFDFNYVKANPEKFQFILFCKDNKSTLTLLQGVSR